MKHSRKHDLEICGKILREMDDVEHFLRGMEKAAFLRSVLHQKATVMSILNIGELSKALSDIFLEATEDRIPWYDIRSARNIAAHTYDALDMDDVWETYEADFPALRAEMDHALAEAPGTPGVNKPPRTERNP